MSLLEGAGNTSTLLEAAQTNALVQIKENLPQQIQVQAQAWNSLDARLAELLSQEYRETKLELPPRTSYYSGVRPGVLAMSWDSFPCLSVMADNASPSAESSSISYGAAYSLQLYVEAIVRSDPFFAGPPENIEERVFQEGLVDRRAKRMLEAIIQCIAIDRTLGALVPELPAPIAGQTDPFTLQGAEPAEQSSKRVFSMIRITYTPSTYASWPDASVPFPPALPSGFGS